MMKRPHLLLILCGVVVHPRIPETNSVVFHLSLLKDKFSRKPYHTDDLSVRFHHKLSQD